MTDETPAKRGETAWKAQCEEVEHRNDAVRKRARGEQQSRDGVVELRIRAQMQREKEQLQALNARLDKQRGRGTR
jgi:hypothetical protein